MPVLLENDITAPRLIILRGSPAVGKSTVAKKLAALNSAKKKAYVPVDDFQLYDLRKPSLDREHLAIKNAAILTKNFLLNGFDVVLDYVFDHIEDEIEFCDFLFSASIDSFKEDIFVQKFYLDAPMEKVIKRNQSRSGKRGEYMNAPLLRKLYQRVSETKGQIPGEVIIDTTPLSAKQCARFILSYTSAEKNNISPVTITLPEKDAARSLESAPTSDEEQ